MININQKTFAELQGDIFKGMGNYRLLSEPLSGDYPLFHSSARSTLSVRMQTWSKLHAVDVMLSDTKLQTEAAATSQTER